MYCHQVSTGSRFSEKGKVTRLSDSETHLENSPGCKDPFVCVFDSTHMVISVACLLVAAGPRTQTVRIVARTRGQSWDQREGGQGVECCEKKPVISDLTAAGPSAS